MRPKRSTSAHAPLSKLRELPTHYTGNAGSCGVRRHWPAIDWFVGGTEAA